MINLPSKNSTEVTKAPANAFFHEMDEFGRILNTSMNMELITSKIKAWFMIKKRFTEDSLKKLFSRSLRISTMALAVNDTISRKATAIRREKEINFLKTAIRKAFFFGAGIDHK